MVSLYIGAAILLYRYVPRERRLILALSCLFGLSIISHHVSQVLLNSNQLVLASTFKSISIFAEGLCILSLLGIFVFGALVPALGMNAPRILQDVTIATTQIVWTLVWLQLEAGVNLTGIIATSAVLTAVIGLAMQDTLGNIVGGLLFTGLALYATYRKPARPNVVALKEAAEAARS